MAFMVPGISSLSVLIQQIFDLRLPSAQITVHASFLPYATLLSLFRPVVARARLRASGPSGKALRTGQRALIVAPLWRSRKMQSAPECSPGAILRLFRRTPDARRTWRWQQCRSTHHNTCRFESCQSPRNSSPPSRRDGQLSLTRPPHPAPIRQLVFACHAPGKARTIACSKGFEQARAVTPRQQGKKRQRKSF
jgi:hypothetical protein